MGSEYDYLHSIEGRLRIKVPGVKRSPATAALIERQLGQLEAIREVRANPTTGNVLVLYEPGGMGPTRIIEELSSRGYLRGPRPTPARGAEVPHGRNAVLAVLPSALAEFLLEATFGPVVGRVLGGLLMAASSGGTPVETSIRSPQARATPYAGGRPRAVA